MKDVRAWILILAVVCFVAGAVAVRMVTERSLAIGPERGAMAQYEAHLVDRFGLDPERERYLRGILQSYELEVQRIKDEHVAAYRSAIEPDLRRLGIEYNALIRDKVLPPSQREAFDRLAAGRVAAEIPTSN